MAIRRQGRPTVETIAKLAEVAKSTVSRALKGHPSISERTRERILKIAEEIGYSPNASARSLVTQRSGVIGFIIGEMTNPFYPEQLERLFDLLSTRNLQLMIFHVPPENDVADMLPVVLQYQVDGCIIASVSLSSKASALCAQYRIPTVLINRVPLDHYTCAVSCNNEAGGRRVAEYLLEAGHTRLAFVAGRADTSTSRDREAGFLSGLAAHGVQLHARAEGGYTFEGGFRAGCELLSGAAPPDGIFAANDIMALGVLDALRERGIRVPGEISVAGFDNIRAASWPAYRLTTIAQPVDTMLNRAIDLLQERIKNPLLPPETHFVAGQFTIRGSTRAVSVAESKVATVMAR